MSNPLLTCDKPAKYSNLLLLALILAGLAGNHFKFPFFLNIEFLFGSIFAMLALQFLGAGRGVLAAALISSYTCVLWNHPYAIIIMTAEVAAVAWLTTRRKVGMVLADTLFWLIIGMPLIFLFYYLALNVPLSNAYVITTNKAMNGIANVLAARLIYTGFVLRSRSAQISYREIVYNLLAFFVLCPSLILLSVGSRADFIETDHAIRSNLMATSQRLGHFLNDWVENRKPPVYKLAEMAAKKSPQQMQPFLEQAVKADPNFIRMGLQDREAVTRAFFPPTDKSGQSTIGKSFADLPFIPELKQALKPMLSETLLSRFNGPKPIVRVVAPVVIDGKYSGFVAGILSLEQIRGQLDKSLAENVTFYTLLDKNGHVIMTNRADQRVMTPFERGKGTFKAFDKSSITYWEPAPASNQPFTGQLNESLYVAGTSIGEQAEWRLMLEQPTMPFHEKLYKNYTSKLTLLFFVLIGSLALAEYLSRKIVATLGKLRTLTHELPDKLASGATEIVWPESGIKEASHLINNFREMADSLSEQFARTWRINESLEKRVGERTEELYRANNELISEINERKVVEKALGKSVGLYHSLVETSQDVIWQCDPEGIFTFLNLAAEQVFGYEVHEMIGKKFSDFQTPENAEYLLTKLEPSIEGGSLDSFESVFTSKSGKEIYLEIKAMFLNDENGEIAGLSGTAYDFTERKLMEKELLQAKSSAEAANMAKSNFLATMSHEVRTPMNCVVGMLQLMEQSGLTAEQQEYAESAKKAGFDLVHLLNDILDLSKIEADKIELEKINFNLQREISDIINILSPSASEKGLKLAASIESDVPVALKGDSGRLRQIIINLVGNAVKFTPKGSVTVQVRKEAEDEQSATLTFLVIDSGIGIAADKLEQVFEYFTQADSSTTRTFGGTGLGLAISRRLVELMGGAIGVESVEGQGSTFRFTVVMEKQGVSPHWVEEIEATSPSVGGLGSVLLFATPIRILLTDDDQTARGIVPKLLKSHGYQVDVAADGKEALQALETNDYALVLMDCMMPGMNGYQVTAAIRNPASSVLRHDIPVIALTGNAMQQDRDECLAAGMDDHLSKPLLLPNLLAMMEKWLKKPD